MQVFLSFSGPTSRRVAEALRDWLMVTLQPVQPFLSEDIDKGAQWPQAIDEALSQSKAGIVCVTRDNLSAPWLLYESGALSRVGRARVCAFLFDVSKADVRPPVGFFQATEFNREDVLKLVLTLNELLRSCGETTVPERALRSGFELTWPTLDEALRGIASTPGGLEPIRSEKDMLGEILVLLRSTVPSGSAPTQSTVRMIVQHVSYETALGVVLHLMNHRDVYGVGPIVKDGGPGDFVHVIFEGAPGRDWGNLTATELDLKRFGLYWGAVSPCSSPSSMQFPKVALRLAPAVGYSQPSTTS